LFVFKIKYINLKKQGVCIQTVFCKGVFEMNLSANAMKIYEILKAQYISAEGCWQRGREMNHYLRRVLNLDLDEFNDAVDELERNNIAYRIQEENVTPQIELSFEKKMEIAKEQGEAMRKRWEQEINRCNWSKDEYNKIYKQMAF
jgi:hypothetical protein